MQPCSRAAVQPWQKSPSCTTSQRERDTRDQKERQRNGRGVIEGSKRVTRQIDRTTICGFPRGGGKREVSIIYQHRPNHGVGGWGDATKAEAGPPWEGDRPAAHSKDNKAPHRLSSVPAAAQGSGWRDRKAKATRRRKQMGTANMCFWFSVSPLRARFHSFCFGSFLILIRF